MGNKRDDFIYPPNMWIYKHVLDRFPIGHAGYAIDVGASDGFSLNTTYMLEKMYGWNVLSVEANPTYRAVLNEQRARVEMCACASEPCESAVFHVHVENPEAFSSLCPTTRNELYQEDMDRSGDSQISWESIEVPVRTLDQLIARWEFPRLDLLCVDTEGTELDVLKGLDIKKWMPKVIVTECWDLEGPIDPYLESFGYTKTERQYDYARNDIFVIVE